jgi:NAD(P)-dependent dehydrogenase (short-subunit alcohol dehydrogenase family)
MHISAAVIQKERSMEGEFSTKMAVVTGGSRGIGREIAVELARWGAQTVIVSSSADNLAAAAKMIAAAGIAPLSITADLRTLEGCQQVFDTVREKFNRCDILVCSAGATRAGNFTELPDQAWQMAMR